MKIRTLVVAIALAALPSLADDPPKTAEADKWLQMYAELAKPSAEHKRLQSMTGEWSIHSRWQLDPTRKAEELTGTASTRAILGGRFVESNARSDGPMAVESLTILGFDRRSNDYTFVSFDTLGTYYVTAAGKWSDEQKAIVMSGVEDDPLLKMKQSYKVRIKPVSDDRFVLTISFDMPDGKEFTAVESTYTRRRS